MDLDIQECEKVAFVVEVDFAKAAFQAFRSLVSSSKNHTLIASNYNQVATELVHIEPNRREVSVIMDSACLLEEDAKVNYIPILDVAETANIDAVMVKFENDENSISYKNGWSDVVFRYNIDM